MAGMGRQAAGSPQNAACGIQASRRRHRRERTFAGNSARGADGRGEPAEGGPARCRGGREIDAPRHALASAARGEAAFGAAVFDRQSRRSVTPYPAAVRCTAFPGSRAHVGRRDAVAGAARHNRSPGREGNDHPQQQQRFRIDVSRRNRLARASGCSMRRPAGTAPRERQPDQLLARRSVAITAASIRRSMTRQEAVGQILDDLDRRQR